QVLSNHGVEGIEIRSCLLASHPPEDINRSGIGEPSSKFIGQYFAEKMCKQILVIINVRFDHNTIYAPTRALKCLGIALVERQLDVSYVELCLFVAKRGPGVEDAGVLFLCKRSHLAGLDYIIDNGLVNIGEEAILRWRKLWVIPDGLPIVI